MTRRQVLLLVVGIIGIIAVSLWAQSTRIRIRVPDDGRTPNFTEAAQWAVGAIAAPPNGEVTSTVLPEEYKALVDDGRIYRFSDSQGNEFAYFPSAAQFGYFYSASGVTPPQPPSAGELTEIDGAWWNGELADEYR